MNRRDFLRVIGLAPIAPMAVVVAPLVAPTPELQVHLSGATDGAALSAAVRQAALQGAKMALAQQHDLARRYG